MSHSEDERIAVDHISKAIDSDQNQSKVAANLTSSLNSVKILRRKLSLLTALMESKEVRTNPEFRSRFN